MLRKKFKPKKYYKKKPLTTRQVLFFTFFLFLSTSILSLFYVNQTVEPTIMKIANTEINRIATEAIYESVEKNMGEINMKDFIVLNKTGTSSPSYSINPNTLISLRTKVSKDIENKLGMVQTNPFQTTVPDNEQFQSVTYYIPLGVVTGNALLANYGPKIPVKMAAVGHVESDFQTNLINSGINNTFLELTVLFKVKIQIVIPSLSKETVVNQKINAGGILINGEVPSYFSNGNGNGIGVVTPSNMKPK